MKISAFSTHLYRFHTISVRKQTIAISQGHEYARICEDMREDVPDVEVITKSNPQVAQNLIEHTFLHTFKKTHTL